MTQRNSARRLARREFLNRFLGNGLFAAGGSMIGAATAYGLYRNRAESGLKNLSRGTFTVYNDGQPSAIMAATTASTTQPAAPQASAVGGVAPVPVPTDVTGQPALIAATAAPALADVQPDLVPVRLKITSLGLDAPVVPIGTTYDDKGQLIWETADHAVGYHLGTGLPGRAGNLVLSGHISSPVHGQGDIFHALPSLAGKLGSRVAIQTNDAKWWYYSVTGTTVVLPAETAVLNPTPTSTLTMLTCVPDGVYDHRFVAQGPFLG